MYDFVGHLKKFGFEWNHNASGFKFEIKIDSKKKKNFFLSRNTRRNISIDHRGYGIWNQLGKLIILLMITADYHF